MTTPPEYPYCVTITKPGLPTVYLGYPFESQADMAASSLRDQMYCTAHPEGTTITYGPTPVGVTVVGPVVPTVDWLAVAIQQQDADRQSVEIEGEQFPDLYARLRAQEPYEPASTLWMAACSLLELLEDGNDDPFEDESPFSDTPAQPHGVTAGYNVDHDTWHVEIYVPGQPVKIISIPPPLIADQENARRMAEQIAEHRRLPHIENNIGITPAGELLDQIRAAAWMKGGDDPDLVAEIVHLHNVDEIAVKAGWAQATVTAAVVRTDETDHTVYRTGGCPEVIAASYGVSLTVAGVYSPADARALAVDLLAAAKRSEEFQARADVRK